MKTARLARFLCATAILCLLGGCVSRPEPAPIVRTIPGSLGATDVFVPAGAWGS